MSALTQSRQLLEAILDSGIQNTNFFNGRVLAAGDLQTDQEANREQHEQLGLAVGAGVVRGLWVELVSDGSDGNPPVISVAQGLAINGNGQAVALPLGVQIALARQKTPAATNAGLFAACTPPASTVVPVQAGIYILVATPTSGFVGQAPMLGFGDVAAAACCGSRYAVEGVLFRLVQLDIATLTRLGQTTKTAIAQLMTQTDAASLSQLRNWIAHVCFGTEEVTGFLDDPFARNVVGAGRQSPYLTYGAIDALVASGDLTASDVPLALLFWTVEGVQFLDRWSVRRRTVPPARSPTWPLPFGIRRRAEAEAIFLQFEEQVQALFGSSVTDAAFAGITAASYFRYLPAAAPIPTNGGGRRGFDIQQFLSGTTFSPQVFIEGARLHAILDAGLDYTPIDLGSGELIWTYLVRENIEAIDTATGTPPQQYLVLATGQMPFAGEARFDVNRWDYANFS